MNVGQDLYTVTTRVEGRTRTLRVRLPHTETATMLQRHPLRSCSCWCVHFTKPMGLKSSNEPSCHIKYPE